MVKTFLEIGKIVGTHGLKGEVRIEPWCDSPQFLSQFKTLYFDGGNKAVKVSARPHKRIAIAKLEGVDTVEQADMMRGKVLWMNRNDVRLENGEYYIQDLIDCKVTDIDTNAEYGIVTDVFKTGANDVYEITDKQKHKFLIPVIPDVVKNVDVFSGEIKIKPMKGIFDDED
ncbi:MULTISPECIES: ribosome maturation factor RimM [unclassified Ruminococcus]|uniref:ribosome maturation factor RimM n=1 Tax=unclassified Ruminococcus TaxID=2608920 RepID=UPI002109D5A9|nr:MULTISPECIES: ribosome maturation factor RimM [unclassified Ruminococcus]MCQ4022324.1 16S rRNA processing protein RimM [Ruminococcus sp. zg-924]MCQ4114652.1 16S rRNA processing protein RimM [Ruminococcus sp. zg-921]